MILLEIFLGIISIGLISSLYRAYKNRHIQKDFFNENLSNAKAIFHIGVLGTIMHLVLLWSFELKRWGVLLFIDKIIMIMFILASIMALVIIFDSVEIDKWQKGTAQVPSFFIYLHYVQLFPYLYYLIFSFSI